MLSSAEDRSPYGFTAIDENAYWTPCKSAGFLDNL